MNLESGLRRQSSLLCALPPPLPSPSLSLSSVLVCRPYFSGLQLFTNFWISHLPHGLPHLPPLIQTYYFMRSGNSLKKQKQTLFIKLFGILHNERCLISCYYWYYDCYKSLHSVLSQTDSGKTKHIQYLKIVIYHDLT